MTSKIKVAILVPVITLLTSGCTFGKVPGEKDNSSSAQSSPTVGGGVNVPGSGSLSAPTGEAIVSRIQNGLENNVSSLTANSNFNKGLVAVKSNLPQVTDPTKATGFDNVELLVYAACSDLTTGTTPKMQSVYSVTKAGTIASNQAALVAAGIRMLDKYTAGLASQGPSSANVSKAFNDIVTNVNVSGNTSTIAFMSVCIAANTAGSSLMSF